MTSTCITSVDLCAIRVSRLTEAGAPLTGANNGYVSEAPISLQVTVETEAGDDKQQKNGCGRLMYVLRTPDLIKGVSLAMVLSQLDADLISMLTDAEVFLDGADAVGYQLAAVGSAPDPVCLEGWTKAWEVDHQFVSDFTDPLATYIHWVFPFNRWVQGDFTLENEILTVPVNGTGSENPSITANGPFNDWPSPVTAKGGVTRLAGWFFDSTIPSQTCAPIAVTSAAS